MNKAPPLNSLLGERDSGMHSGAVKIYVANGCFLIVLQLTWAIGSRLAYMYDVLFMGLGVLSIILGLLQPLALLSLTVKLALSIVYCVGIWSLSFPYLWLIGTFSEHPIPSIDYVLPGLVFAPVVATFFGIVRSDDMDSSIGRRIYVVGGLSIVAVLIAGLWYDMVAKWYLETGGVGQVSNDVFWYPVIFVLAMGALVLGLLPQPRKLAHLISTCYLVGAILVAFAARVGTYPPEWYAPYLLTAGFGLMLPGIFAAMYRVIVGKE